MAKNIAVYGIYRTREMVKHAVEELKKADFRNTDISVLFPERMPSENELDAARYQGKHVAQIAVKLARKD